LASRRRRRKSIGKVIVDVERRVRRVEKRPGAKRLKANVVTTEKLGYRAVTTKVIQANAVTANEAEFGVTVVSDTDPTIIKEGTTVVDPVTGEQKVYSEDISAFVTVTDPAAQAAADSKSAVYYQDNEPAGTAYEVGDIWIDTNDNDKLYAWDGTDWVLSQDSAAAQATADGKAKTYVQDNEPTGGVYNAGDLWIDTNDGNKLYRYSGSAWVSAQDGAISTAQQTANGKNKVYYDTAAPGSTPNNAGDIWWQYSSGVVIGQFVGGGGTTWTSAPIGNAVIANLDAGKITTGFLNVAGTVKITTSAAASGTGGFTPRIEINSDGFFAYNGSVATVSITNSGTAVFTGSITGSAISGGTVSGATITLTGSQSVISNPSSGTWSQTSDTSNKLNFTAANYSIIPAGETTTYEVSGGYYDPVNEIWVESFSNETRTTSTVKITDTTLQGQIPSSTFYYGELYVESGSGSGGTTMWANYNGGYISFEVIASSTEKSFYIRGDGTNWTNTHDTTGGADQPAYLQADSAGKITRGRAIFTSGSSSATILGSSWSGVGQNGDLAFSTGN